MGDSGLTALLFSGGTDSLALAYLHKPDLLVTINYGQAVAAAEIKAAQYFAKELRLPLTVLEADLRCTGAGSLANELPSGKSNHPEWWPFRNQLLISVAAAWGIKNGVAKILIGTVKTDSCFADGSTSFIQAMRGLLAIQEGAIQLEAPAIGMSTVELIRTSGMPTRLIPMCFSCNASESPCGACRSCIKFSETLYTFLDENS